MRVLCAGMGDPHLRDLSEWQMKIGNCTEEDAGGASVDPSAERVVRISDRRQGGSSRPHQRRVSQLGRVRP